jgi:DNA-binding NtrC family response regulator
MSKEKILIVDDDPQIRLVLADRLHASGFCVHQAHNGKRGLEVVAEENPDLVLLDLQMPEMDGLEVLSRLQKNCPDLPVIMLTAHGSIEHAVDAMKRGASDFLPKPCKPDHILLVVQKALERKYLKEENRFLRQEIDHQYEMIVGENPGIKEVIAMAEKAAESRTTILIGGESGTGKQLLARAVHNMSDRSSKPFVQVTCTTLSEQLLESDLFGHEKGAFTGAVKQKKGRFELAHKGTLFFDEIGDMSPSIQAKLLHVLEYGEFQRVGGVDTLKADVRFIAATNKDLQKQVKEGRFREDLYYRLNVMTLQLPPLRSRPEDIPLFANTFLEKHSRTMQKDIKGFSGKAMEDMQSYSWPGNIRELDNAVQRAVVLSTGEQLTHDLFILSSGQDSVQDITVGMPLDEALLEFKKEFITKTLSSTHHNQTKAAELLNIQRTYLNRLIKELDL